MLVILFCLQILRKSAIPDVSSEWSPIETEAYEEVVLFSVAVIPASCHLSTVMKMFLWSYESLLGDSTFTQNCGSLTHRPITRQPATLNPTPLSQN